MPSVIIFPGQGSQFVGMGKNLLNLPKVVRMFEIANNQLKFDLLGMCLNGPQAELDKTIHTQAAVYVTSLAAVEYLKETNPQAIRECYATAGFSVGEYASLVLAGSIKYEDGLRLIKVRSEAMQKASESVPSGLMTVYTGRQSKLNLAMAAARKWCKEALNLNEPIVCEIANYLFAECKVIGGNKQALDFIETNQKEFNLKRIKRLPVSGAFHTKLMQPAERALYATLSTVDVRKPIIDFYSNYEGKISENSPSIIKKNLIKQLASPVKWEQIINTIYYDENLPLSTEDENEEPQKDVQNKVDRIVDRKDESNNETIIKKGQSKDREYPDVYECGPASQTGPILKVINRKAHNFYKHIGV